MSELLIDALDAALRAHGLASERRGAVLHSQDGLTLEPRILPRETAPGASQVQVDFAVESPLLNGLTLLDSFAGIGDSSESAERNALQKFLMGSFHVIVEALTRHRCNEDQVQWEDWTAAQHGWRVCTGPLLAVATRDDAGIEGYPEFFAQLAELFRARVSSGPHGLRVFVGSLDGKLARHEVLLDGEPWPQAQELLAAHGFTFPPGYASVRHLLIALPGTG